MILHTLLLALAFWFAAFGFSLWLEEGFPGKVHKVEYSIKSPFEYNQVRAITRLGASPLTNGDSFNPVNAIRKKGFAKRKVIPP